MGSGFNANGFLVGGTLGGNYQINKFVIGVEDDFDYNSANGTLPSGNSFTSNWLSTVRGRAGLAWDRFLVFGTGGAAFASANIFAATGAFAGGSTTMIGWTAGGGIEYTFTPNWTPSSNSSTSISRAGELPARASRTRKTLCALASTTSSAGSSGKS